MEEESGYHCAIIRKARVGKEAEFEAALRSFIKHSLEDPGTLGAHLVMPGPAGKEGEFGILRTFKSKQASKGFYESKLFKDWEESVADLIDGSAVRRPLHGLEAFFRGKGGPPPRWKMALITWFSVVPTIIFWDFILSPITGSFQPTVSLAVTCVFVVVSLSWILMPGLTRLLKPWLTVQ